MNIVQKGVLHVPKVLESPRQRIVETARQILLERGYEELSIREVAKECHLSVGTIYNYFTTKHDLIVHIMVEHWDNYLRKVTMIDHTETDIFVKLRQMYEQMCLFINTFQGVWVKANLDHREAHTKDKLQKHRDYVEKLVGVYAEIIQRDVARDAERLQLPIAEQDFARFVIQNFLIISQMKQFDYDTFEKILRKLMLK